MLESDSFPLEYFKSQLAPAQMKSITAKEASKAAASGSEAPLILEFAYALDLHGIHAGGWW